MSLDRDDHIALEATSKAFAIAAILRPHVGRVVLVDPKAAKGVVGGKKTN